MNLSTKDFQLAVRIASWIGSTYNINTIIEELDTGVLLVTYSSDHPPVRVEKGRIIWPKGTDLDLMLAFLGGLT